MPHLVHLRKRDFAFQMFIIVIAIALLLYKIAKENVTILSVVAFPHGQIVCHVVRGSMPNRSREHKDQWNSLRHWASFQREVPVGLNRVSVRTEYYIVETATRVAEATSVKTGTLWAILQNYFCRKITARFWYIILGTKWVCNCKFTPSRKCPNPY